MAYVAPNTVLALSTLSAATWNQDVVANSIALHPGHQVLTTVQKNALTGVVAGTMVYDTTLGRLQLWNGTAWGEPWASNNLVYASSSTQNSTTTANAWITSNISAVITPRSATSKVLINTSLFAAVFQGTPTNTVIPARILRNGSSIYQVGSSTSVGAMYMQAAYNSNSQIAIGGLIPMQYMDTPATTSATTYTFEVQLSSNGGTLYTNYSSNLSTAVVQEITA